MISLIKSTRLVQASYSQVDKYQDVGTLTDPESLGACEPGTAISLEGIVWNETKGGNLHTKKITRKIKKKGEGKVVDYLKAQ